MPSWTLQTAELNLVLSGGTSWWTEEAAPEQPGDRLTQQCQPALRGMGSATRERAAGPVWSVSALLRGCTVKEFAKNLSNNCVTELSNTAWMRGLRVVGRKQGHKCPGVTLEKGRRKCQGGRCKKGAGDLMAFLMTEGETWVPCLTLQPGTGRFWLLPYTSPVAVVKTLHRQIVFTSQKTPETSFMQLVEAGRTMRQEIAFAKGKKDFLTAFAVLMQERKKGKCYDLFARWNGSVILQD